MIRNELYIGNLVLQQKCCPDGEVRKSVRNKGLLPKYRVENAHEPIISRELFDAVQDDIRKRRGNTENQYTHPTIFSGRVICGLCESHCGRMNQHSTSQGKQINVKVWKCIRRRNEGKDACSLKNIHEDELISLTLEAFGLDEIDLYGRNSLFDSVTVFPDHVTFWTGNRSIYVERSRNGQDGDKDTCGHKQ